MLLTKYEEEEEIKSHISGISPKEVFFGEPVYSTGTEIRLTGPTRPTISINDEDDIYVSYETMYSRWQEQVRASYGRQADGSIPF